MGANNSIQHAGVQVCSLSLAWRLVRLLEVPRARTRLCPRPLCVISLIVQYILDSVLLALEANPDRKFIYVEQVRKSTDGVSHTPVGGFQAAATMRA